MYISEVPLMQLRPHQQRALDAIANHSKGQIIIPTGGGKTLVAIIDAVRLYEKEAFATIVVVAPRILLIFYDFFINLPASLSRRGFLMQIHGK